MKGTLMAPSSGQKKKLKKYIMPSNHLEKSDFFIPDKKIVIFLA